MQQSLEDVARLFDEYARSFKPADLILDHQSARARHNASRMYAYAVEKHGWVTISALIEAEKVLGAQLERKQQPKQLTPAEIEIDRAIKSEAKMRKDYQDSLRPQFVVTCQEDAAQRAAIATKEATAKELKGIVSQIEREISSYTRGHASGWMDYAATESGQQGLRAVRDQHDRSTIANAKACLSAVRLAKSKLS